MPYKTLIFVVLVWGFKLVMFDSLFFSKNNSIVLSSESLYFIPKVDNFCPSKSLATLPSLKEYTYHIFSFHHEKIIYVVNKQRINYTMWTLWALKSYHFICPSAETHLTDKQHMSNDDNFRQSVQRDKPLLLSLR